MSRTALSDSAIRVASRRLQASSRIDRDKFAYAPAKKNSIAPRSHDVFFRDARARVATTLKPMTRARIGAGDRRQR
jgi:hypothetical protein